MTFIVRAAPVIHKAPQHGKQARGYSNASPEATTFLFGGLASPDGHHPKTIKYRAPVVGHSFASAEQQPMDLQEIRKERWHQRIPCIGARAFQGKGLLVRRARDAALSA